MILGIGDLHIEKLDGVIPNGSRLQLRALEKVLSLGRKSGARHAVMLGDLFDSSMPSQDSVLALLRVMADSDMTFHILLGNHDRPEIDEHSLKVHKWVLDSKLLKGKVYDTPEVVKLDGGSYWMCPHPYIEPAPSKVNLSFGHFAWHGAVADNGYRMKSGASPAGNWVLGDFHTPSSGKRYTYAGSLTQLTFGENPDKGYLEIDGSKVTFKPLSPAVAGYVMKNVSVHSDKELTKLKPRKLRDGTRVFYHATFEGGYQPKAGWQQDFPHIIRHSHGLKTINEERRVAAARFMLSEDPLEGLPAWLGSREMEKPDRKRAMSLAKSIKLELS